MPGATGSGNRFKISKHNTSYSKAPAVQPGLNLILFPALSILFAFAGIRNRMLCAEE